MEILSIIIIFIIVGLILALITIVEYFSQKKVIKTYKDNGLDQKYSKL